MLLSEEINNAHHGEPLKKINQIRKCLPSKLKPVILSYLLFSTTSEHYWVVLCPNFCKTFDFKTDTKIKHKRNTYTTGKTLGKTTLASAKYS